MTQTMKAARIERFGAPEVLVFGDYPIPDIGPSDVLVRVLATTVSRWDVKYRTGDAARGCLPGRRQFLLPMQPGRDAVGVVEAIGPDVTRFRTGQHVVGLVHPANPVSPLTIIGLGNLSTDIDYPGHTMFGGNAQYVCRPESYWLTLPEGVLPSEAAAAMWSYATSHRILCDRLSARPGTTIVVIGGTGGMGTATLDLARVMGIRVVATSRSPDKLEFLRERGAEAAVMLGADNVGRLREVVGGLGADAAVDYSGDPSMMRLCIDLLRPGGTFVPLAGEGSNDPMPITAADCVKLELNIRGARASTISDQQAVLNLLAQGRIKPAIHTVLPLHEIVAAHEMLESSLVLGRVVIDPWAST